MNARGTRRPRTSKPRGPRVKVPKTGGGGSDGPGCWPAIAAPFFLVAFFLLAR